MIKQISEIEKNLTRLQELVSNYNNLINYNEQNLNDLKEKLNEEEKERANNIKEVQTLRGKVDDLENQVKSWYDKYQSLERAKRQVDDQLNLYKKAEGTMSGNIDYVVLDNRVKALEINASTTQEKVEELWREKRGIQDQMGIDIRKNCETMNDHLEQISQTLKEEHDKFSDLNNRMKRQTIQFNQMSTTKLWLNRIWKSASYGAVGLEGYLRADQISILRNTIITNYNEYLENAKLTSKLNNATIIYLKGVDTNLGYLNKMANETSSKLNELVKEINRMKDYSIASRVLTTLKIEYCPVWVY